MIIYEACCLKEKDADRKKTPTVRHFQKRERAAARCAAAWSLDIFCWTQGPG